MGAQIAAHFGNAGVPVILLDLTREIAREGLKRARGLKPDPFFTPDAAALVTTGGFDTEFARLQEVDWILEAVVERLDVKQELIARIETVRRPGTIVRRTPPHLIGVIASAGAPSSGAIGWGIISSTRLATCSCRDSDGGYRSGRRGPVSGLPITARRRRGRERHTNPSPIASTVRCHLVMKALESGTLTIEDIDAITGPALGRPKSATFRTMDIAGLDVLGHVARNLLTQLPADEAERFALPPLVRTLIEKGWVGEKSGQGFYKRQKTASGPEILTLDPPTLTYRPRQSPRLPALDAARAIEDPAERTKTLFLGQDQVGAFLRATLGELLLYAARVAPEIAHGIDDVDRAMRWGFGWELGPFEIWDAIGVREVLAATKAAEPPPLVAELLTAGRNRFRDGILPPAGPDRQLLGRARERGGVVKKNAGASLVDLGDGVLAVEFHSKLNTVGGDTLEMLHAGVKEAAANFSALVIGNDAPNFSAGANLMLLLLEAQEGNWDDIDLMVRSFQGATQALRYADVPVIVCPVGLTLGGGCEIALHGDRVQAAAESYIGLVEAGVGLIPAGGGAKEMLARSVEGLTDPRADLLPRAQRVFETIGFAKVSTSAADALRLGYLRPVDAITMNREHLMADAKSLALERVREGYHPPAHRMAIPVGGDAVLAPLKLRPSAWRAGRPAM